MKMPPDKKLRQMAAEYVAEYEKATKDLSFEELVRFNRKQSVARTLKFRKMLPLAKHPDDRDMIEFALEREQLALLKLREWRRTGLYPGEA